MTDGEPVQARSRILASASALVAEVGVDGMSIRDVCKAAGVTAPTVYHHFGDRKGLLDAVAADGFDRYLAEKRRRGPSADPVEDLRLGWDGHLEFGLRHPALYGLMYGGVRTTQHPAAAEGERMLRGIVTRIADAGLLRTSVDSAVHAIHAATVGATLMLITNADAPGMDGLSEQMREIVLSSVLVTTRTELRGLAAAAADLLGLLARAPVASLTPGELGILRELLGRLSSS